MFGTIGGPELLLVLVIALIVFGPRQLPEIGKSLGRMLVEFRRAGNDFKRTLEDEVEADKVRSTLPAPVEAHAAPEPQAPAPAVGSIPAAGEPADSGAGESEPAASEPAASGENK